MSKTSGNLGDDTSIGPDFFGLYKSEIAELLAQDGIFWPPSHQSSDHCGSLSGLSKENYRSESVCTKAKNNSCSSPTSFYFNGVGALLSEVGKERLKVLLRQSVFTLSQEVDEVVNPVISLCRVRSCLKYKDYLLSGCNGSSESDQRQHPSKKLKVPTSSLGKESSCGVAAKCAQGHATRTQQRKGTHGNKFLCNACEPELENGMEMRSSMCAHNEAYKGNAEIDDDLRFLLENDSNKVEDLMNTHYNELFTTLKHMERSLEELLNTTMTTCRTMTVNEKQQLRKLIKELPPKNVDHVLEMLKHSRPSTKDSYDEVYIDLDEEDNVTLWRLYFYVAAIKNASALQSRNRTGLCHS